MGFDDRERFTCRDTHCPACGSKDRNRFVMVPSHRREWTEGGEEYVEHWGVCRDYTCGNCEAEWTMPEETP